MVAVSSDYGARAERSKNDWGLGALKVAYGLSIEQARDWGLYISHAIHESEPSLFIEPGLFLVRPDQTLYAASIQSMPFARPQFTDILGAVGFIGKRNYPARGDA